VVPLLGPARPRASKQDGLEFSSDAAKVLWPGEGDVMPFVTLDLACFPS
jgi:hypothetical protein